MLSTSKGVRLQYSEKTKSFLLTTELALTQTQMLAVLNHAKKEYTFKMKGMIGDKRKAFEEMISNLRPERVTQRFENTPTEKTLFQNNQKTTNKLYHYNK